MHLWQISKGILNLVSFFSKSKSFFDGKIFQTRQLIDLLRPAHEKLVLITYSKCHSLKKHSQQPTCRVKGLVICINFTSCVHEMKADIRLCRCTCLPGPLLVTFTI